MNLGEFRTAVGRRTGIAFGATSANDAINAALHQLVLERDWPWYDAVYSFTTDTTGSVDLSALNIANIRAVQVNGWGYALARTADAETWDTETSHGFGPARIFTLDGSTLYLRPEPASGLAGEVHYVALEATLANDSDTPTLPTQFHDALVELAASYVCDRAGDLARAARFEQRYTGWVRRMEKGALHRSGRRGSITVRPGAGI